MTNNNYLLNGKVLNKTITIKNSKYRTSDVMTCYLHNGATQSSSYIRIYMNKDCAKLNFVYD